MSDATADKFPAITTQTRVVYGIWLPWQEVEPTGPITLDDGRVVHPERPPKGTVLDSGEVFVELSTLSELAEQDRWDSQFGSALLLGRREGLALEAAGLAERETRGGFHRTDRLREFLDHIACTGLPTG